MTVTDAEKLALLREYVEDMWPVYRPQILRTPEHEAENKGWDHASYYHQEILTQILDGDTS